MDPIVHDIEFAAPVEDLWAAFTEPARIARWLSAAAEVDLEEDGRYALLGAFGAPASTERLGGRILSLEEEYSLRVGWNGPEALAGLLNVAPPPTTLFVRFQPLGPARSRLHLEHLGWGDGEAWSAARQWHVDYWREALGRLKPVVEA
ncbi:MAG TPA: SRPBCC domain-containing protein [Thermoplasmata archaeon]|nr:SRPBCC domain-containing protein [Thermoplasmata archaeon]